MQIGRFHKTWNDRQPELCAELTTYTRSYNHLRAIKR